MANEDHLAILGQGVEAWNAWREEHPEVRPDLSDADLVGANLVGANLRRADLSYGSLNKAVLDEAILSGADLRRASFNEATLDRARLLAANLRGAWLIGASLVGTTLDHADFSRTNLADARLDHAVLDRVDLSDASLIGASLVGAFLSETVFADVDLSSCMGLETCRHYGPSIIDVRTLQRSGPLPRAFLRGVGLPDRLIESLPSILEQAIPLYSCFISYSSKDEDFAQRLHADLQASGVRCWFAPEDMKIGDRIEATIDTAIRLRDKLLLILSATSVTSAWVRKEVRTALAEKERDGRTVLFPVRVDDAVMDTTEQWADDIKRTHHIGDFTRWKEHDAYAKALERLLRDLRVEKA